MTKLFLFDIEGTTTDINFVHKVLFPYSTANLESYVREHHHNTQVAKAIESVKETVLTEDNKSIDLDGVIEKLKEWIKTDRKHGALKEIQGHIWDIGYSRNDFKGHVYPDVKPAFIKILENGSKVGIYSSGSVHAQKLIFGFSTDGDLTPMISYYFDTKVGAKREKASYEVIAKEVGLDPKDIRFFSDIPEELEAAELAGYEVTHVLRPGTKVSKYKAVEDFNEI